MLGHATISRSPDRDRSRARHRPGQLWRGRGLALAVSGLLLVTLAACGTAAEPSGSVSSTGTVQVVAGENFWGSLAAQLGGSKVNVTSIVSDPNADPHEYETSPADARAFTAADFVILNGAGYDDWGAKLLSAQPNAERTVLTVAQYLGKKPGDNPHFWYNPGYVFRVIDKITEDYQALRPQEATYFAARHVALESALAPYRSRLRSITAHYSGQPVAATESIFQYLADYLHLDLVSPPAFMKAVAEGVDPPAASVASFDRQIQDKRFGVLVYNTQTVTPLTTMIKEQADSQDIAVIGISETIQPPTESFQRWMEDELDTLTDALRTHRRTS